MTLKPRLPQRRFLSQAHGRLANPPGRRGHLRDPAKLPFHDPGRPGRTLPLRPFCGPPPEHRRLKVTARRSRTAESPSSSASRGTTWPCGRRSWCVSTNNSTSRTGTSSRWRSTSASSRSVHFQPRPPKCWGATLAPSATVSATLQLQIMQDFRSTVLATSTAFALHIVDTMSHAGLEPGSLKLKLVLVARTLSPNPPANGWNRFRSAGLRPLWA